MLKNKHYFIHLAASNEQKQRSRAPSIHASAANNSDSYRRSTSSLQESPTPRLPSSVCSMSGDPLVIIYI